MTILLLASILYIFSIVGTVPAEEVNLAVDGEHSLLWYVLGAYSILTTGFIAWNYLGLKEKWERWLRMRKNASDQERREMSDFIVDVVEDMVHKNKMTRKRAKDWYRQFAEVLELQDLLPRMSEKQRVLFLKQEITRRRLNGGSKPVVLPKEDKPRKDRVEIKLPR